MEITTLLAVFAPIILFFKQCQGIFLKVFRVFWKNRIVPPDYRFRFYKQLLGQSGRVSLDDYNLKSYGLYSFGDKKYYDVPIKQFSFEILFYKKFIPVLVFSQPNDTLKIQYLKFTFPFERILENCVTEYRQSIKTKKEDWRYFAISEQRGESLKKSKSIVSNSAPSSGYGSVAPTENNSSPILYISEELSLQRQENFIGINLQDIGFCAPQSQSSYLFTKTGEHIQKQVEKWLGAREWYNAKNIVWKRSILLNGKPGNGKSSIVKEITRRLEMQIHIFDLSSMDNEEFSEKLLNIGSTPSIFLFEDIDTVFEQRVNQQKSEQFGGLTFDYFINKLDGVNGIYNKFVFMTTNHLEKLDPALIRPGRVDQIIHIEPLTLEEKKSLATNIFAPHLELVDETVQNGLNDTTAEFQNRCITIALNKLWAQ